MPVVETKNKHWCARLNQWNIRMLVWFAAEELRGSGENECWMLAQSWEFDQGQKDY
jgi:hypothetical protein